MSERGFRIEDGVPWIGDRSFPWANEVDVSDAVTIGLVWRNRGFHLMFETGAMLSIQWGSGTYSHNHVHRGDGWHEECPDAEIAIWSAGGDWFTHEGDEVHGHCSVAFVLAVIDVLAGQGPKALPERFALLRSGPSPSLPKIES